MNDSIGISDTPSDELAFLDNPLIRFSHEAKDIKVYRLSVWEEIIGTLLSFEQPQDGGLVALIGKIFVVLPEEMAAMLQELQGRKIGVIRTDEDYRLRVITAKSNRDVCSNSITQDAL